MDFLLQAAKSWVEISKNYYAITYGVKRKLHIINIMFEDADFFHLAGFQYLKDLDLPVVSRPKIVSSVLNGKINGKDIRNGTKYLSHVESRLIALISLEASLDKEFRFFKYNPQHYPFYTRIEADYLIEGYTEGNSLFFFTVKIRESYNGASIFMKTDTDFSTNQKPLSLLKKEKINIKTKNKTILLDRLSTQKPLINQ